MPRAKVAKKHEEREVTPIQLVDMILDQIEEEERQRIHRFSLPPGVELKEDPNGEYVKLEELIP